MIPNRIVVAIVISTEVIKFFFITVLLGHPHSGDEHIDQLDSYKRHNDAANSVDPEIAAQKDCSSHRPVLHSAQSEGNQGDNNQSIEDDSRQNRRLRSLKVHDV